MIALPTAFNWVGVSVLKIVLGASPVHDTTLLTYVGGSLPSTPLPIHLFIALEKERFT
jgi:hypothetical protein